MDFFFSCIFLYTVKDKSNFKKEIKQPKIAAPMKAERGNWAQLSQLTGEVAQLCFREMHNYGGDWVI